MDIGQYFEEAMAQNDSFGEDKSSLEKWTAIPDSENSTPGCFDCNICLETVQDPVVTLCGHLFCWPCLYKWLHFQSSFTENQDLKRQQCPICKAEISQASLVPLYGKGQTAKPFTAGKAIPRRPPAPACGVDTTDQTQQLYHANYSTIGHVFGGTIYARVFGNSTISNLYTYPNTYHLVGSTNPRVRRHVMQVESLSRICFFLFCCAVLCLLSF